MTGFIESNFDPRDLEFEKESDIQTENIPYEYDYSKYVDIKVKDQGRTYTCVPHSISTVIETQYFDEGRTIDIDSVYGRRSEPEHDGMMIRDALKIVKKDLGNPFFKYFRLRSIMQIKWSLIANGPCIFALPVRSNYNDFWRGDEDLGGHAIACVGYNDEGFILQNSWGTSWGFNGKCILPYEDVRFLIEAWGIE